MCNYRIFLQDIVMLVGVIKMTVSCYICLLKKVVKETGECIVKIMEEINYIFNCVFGMLLNV